MTLRFLLYNGPLLLMDREYELPYFVKDVICAANGVLVFEGLDTYCNIYVNGIKVGFADNMFIPHSFNISNFIRIVKNSLCVESLSPIKYVQNKETLPGAFTTERLLTRRMQCN